jgi:Ca2+:H+ antiporter
MSPIWACPAGGMEVIMKFLYVLLVFIPATIIERFVFHTNDGIVFITSCLAIVPLAVVLGDATEQVAIYAGPKIGGFLNATMGNVPELLISGFAVKAGLYTLVLASLAGSIIGNILLVLGLSIFIGGIRYKFQTFNGNIMRSNFVLLVFAGASIIIPFAFKMFGGEGVTTESVKSFSLIIAVIMLLVYISGLIFSLFTHKDIFKSESGGEEEEEEAKWKLPFAIGILAVATVFVALMSETLVATVEVAAEQFGLSEAFIGIILIPILGNVAEHAAAMMMAYKKKLDISIEIACGSSMQIALFVTPLMIVFSAVLGNTMEYIYTPSELLAMIIGIIMAAFVLADHKTNWLEGFQLFVAYGVLGAAFLIFGL